MTREHNNNGVGHFYLFEPKLNITHKNSTIKSICREEIAIKTILHHILVIYIVQCVGAGQSNKLIKKSY